MDTTNVLTPICQPVLYGMLYQNNTSITLCGMIMYLFYIDTHCSNQNPNNVYLIDSHESN